MLSVSKVSRFWSPLVERSEATGARRSAREDRRRRMRESGGRARSPNEERPCVSIESSASGASGRAQAPRACCRRRLRAAPADVSSSNYRLEIWRDSPRPQAHRERERRKRGAAEVEMGRIARRGRLAHKSGPNAAELPAGPSLPLSRAAPGRLTIDLGALAETGARLRAGPSRDDGPPWSRRR